jgi:shikimate kinase
LIEAKARTSITSLIREEGEQQFRLREREALLEAFAADLDAVSLGGGGLLREDNRKLVLDQGLVVHLAVSPEVAAARVSAEEVEARKQGKPVVRPVLSAEEADFSVAAVQQSVRKLMEARKGLYDCAQLTINTDALPPAEIAELIVGKAAALGAGNKTRKVE